MVRVSAWRGEGEGWRAYSSYASRIGLDACDAGFLCFADGLRGCRFVKIERHEVVDIRIDGL
jgi:hypothetical protein